MFRLSETVWRLDKCDLAEQNTFIVVKKTVVEVFQIN